MPSKLDILLIDDNPADFDPIKRQFTDAGVMATLHTVCRLEDLRAALDAGGWDIALSDYGVAGLDFDRILSLLKPWLEDRPLILVSGRVDETQAVGLLKRGVWDFVLKPNLGRLMPAIERSWRDARDRRELRAAHAALRDSQQQRDAVLNSATCHIALLDHGGTITAVNAAWQRFSQENSPEAAKATSESFVGRNYLAVCRQSQGPFAEGAMAAHDGIQAVLERRLPEYRVEYACHSPEERRSFLMVATPLGHEKGEAMISHLNITECKRTERLQALSAEVMRVLNDPDALPECHQGHSECHSASDRH